MSPRAFVKLIPKKLRKRNTRIGTRAIGVFARILKRVKGVPHILLVRQQGKRTWSLPGGKLEPGESVLEGLHREIAEETSLEISTARSTPIRVISREDQHYLVLIFDVTPLRDSVLKPKNEITALQYFPLTKFPRRLSPQARALLKTPEGFQELRG